MSKPEPDNVPQSYESALAELEGIVAAMEQGQMPLEQSIEAYRRGMELLKFCQAQLAEAQQKVRILEGETLQNFPGTDDQS